MHRLTFIVIMALATFMLAQGGKTASPAKNNAANQKPPAGPMKVSGKPVTTASGLEYWDIKKGGGETAVNGKQVSVNFTGWLADGKEIDSSFDAGEPVEFQLGSDKVIKGWNEGIAGMKVGGKRQLRVPPALAYGDSGRAPTIPPKSTLIFDVELVAVK
jgi:FKBP-type peptidyl-prolyl cis-trans isomerase